MEDRFGVNYKVLATLSGIAVFIEVKVTVDSRKER